MALQKSPTQKGPQGNINTATSPKDWAHPVLAQEEPFLVEKASPAHPINSMAGPSMCATCPHQARGNYPTNQPLMTFKAIKSITSPKSAKIQNNIQKGSRIKDKELKFNSQHLCGPTRINITRPNNEVMSKFIFPSSLTQYDLYIEKNNHCSGIVDMTIEVSSKEFNTSLSQNEGEYIHMQDRSKTHTSISTQNGSGANPTNATTSYPANLHHIPSPTESSALVVAGNWPSRPITYVPSQDGGTIGEHFGSGSGVHCANRKEECGPCTSELRDECIMKTLWRNGLMGNNNPSNSMELDALISQTFLSLSFFPFTQYLPDTQNLTSDEQPPTVPRRSHEKRTTKRPKGCQLWSYFEETTKKWRKF